MNTKNMKNNKGFTLAELLIVVAIIGVLVGVSIPIFNSQLDKARIATDQANVRSAKAAALAEYMTENNSGAVTYYYDAAKGKVVTDAAGIAGYGRYTKDDKQEEIGASGTPNKNGNANYVIAVINSDYSVSMRWSGGLSTWSSIDGIHMTASNYYNHSTQREADFYKLLQTDNEIRKQADLEVLNELASYFDGLSAEEAKNILGTNRFNLAQNSNNSMLFQFGQDGGGSIRLSGFDTDNNSYLFDIGVDTKVYSNPAGYETNQFLSSGSNNYVDSYIFSSNEMLGDHYKSNVFHNVRIKFNVVDGKVTNTKVWVQGLDGFTSD